MSEPKLECHDCGSLEIVKVLDDCDDASGYKGAIAFCKACWEKRARA